MSFGRATEDNHLYGQGIQIKSLHHNKLAAATNIPLLNMNRQYKSDRNVFNARNGGGGSKAKDNTSLSPL